MNVRIADIEAALRERGLLVGTRGNLPDAASGISDDSRQAKPGGLFVAVKGWNADGHDFLESPRHAGASGLRAAGCARRRNPTPTRS